MTIRFLSDTLNNDFAHTSKKDSELDYNQQQSACNAPKQPQKKIAVTLNCKHYESSDSSSLLVVIFSSLSQKVGELKTLLTNPNANPNLAEVDPF